MAFFVIFAKFTMSTAEKHRAASESCPVKLDLCRKSHHKLPQKRELFRYCIKRVLSTG